MNYRISEKITEYKDNETEKEYIIIPESGEILELNETAKLIMKCIKDKYDINGIVTKILKTCPDIHDNEVEKDVKEFVDTMITKKIIYFN